MAIYKIALLALLSACTTQSATAKENLMQVTFDTGDEVRIYQDGELTYPIPGEHPTIFVEPNTAESFSAFGSDWKRNASDYEYAISDLEDGGQRFILRQGDMRPGSDTSNLRERAEASGSDEAEPIAGTFDADFLVTPQAYDTADWSSMVQIITDDTDPNMSYQPLIKMQHRNGIISLDAYAPGQFENISNIAAPPTGTDMLVRITIDFSTGYVRWSIDNSTIFSGQVPILAIEGTTSGLVYFKYGAYRQGPIAETAVTDFHDVSFVKR